MKQKMISLGYCRISSTEFYRAKMELVEVDSEAEDTRSLICWTANRVSMRSIIKELHHTLKRHPDAKVTMIQDPPAALIFKRKPRGFELDEKLTALIRDDPDKAMEMFKPIERTVTVRPSRVTLPSKESKDADEAKK